MSPLMNRRVEVQPYVRYDQGSKDIVTGMGVEWRQSCQRCYVSIPEKDGIEVFKIGYRFSRKCDKPMQLVAYPLDHALQLLKERFF